MKNNNEKFYTDYTDKERQRINDCILMCSEMDGSSLDLVEGSFKLAIMQGQMRQEDSESLLEKSPYLMMIIIGGLKTNMKRFKNRQRIRPYPIRLFFDALLHYDRLIISDYGEFKVKVNDVHREVNNPIQSAIREVANVKK